MTHWLRIGTRGSPLALAQTGEVRRAIAAANGVAETDIEIVAIKTSGDIIQDRALSEAGGKGLFTKELDIAMLEGRIDVAVHSSKDLPTVLPAGIVIAGYPRREDPRDALICRNALAISDLRERARVGTASLRRAAQLKRLRPDFRIELLRGNVETRLRKIDEGAIDATLLALAGLRRLGLAHHAAAVLDIDDFLPAVGQGAVGITARADDARARTALALVLDADTGHAVEAERAFLRVLDGSCRTPIAGLARVEAGRVKFRGMVLRPDGSDCLEIADEDSVSAATAMGQRAGEALRGKMPTDFMTTA